MTKQAIERSPLASGKKELLKHMNNEPISRMQAMKAKCFECCNGFIDGRVDCRIPTCPIYPWMPYRDGKGRSDSE